MLVYDSISGRYYTVTSVAPDAFKDQTILKNVTLPTSVTRIGAHAFEGTSIEDVVVPGSTYHVEEGAYATPTVKTVHIYAPGQDGSADLDHSVELQDGAFGVADGGQLSDVYIGYKNPPVVADGNKPFPQVAAHHSSAKLHVDPEANEEDFKTPYCWSDFYTLDPSGIESVETDAPDAAAEYYTLQGRQVNAGDLIPGIYIMKRGEKVTKAVVR